MTSIPLEPLGASKPPLPPRPPKPSETTVQDDHDTFQKRRNDFNSGIGGATGQLGKAYKIAEEKAKAAVVLNEGGLDSVSVYGLGLTIWFTILSLPLFLFPRILLFFSQKPPPSTTFSTFSPQVDHYDSLSSLESSLCFSLATTYLLLALISLSVLVPSYTPRSPARSPILGLYLIFVTFISLLGIVNSSRVKSGGYGGLGKMINFGYAGMAIWGWWVVVFGKIKSSHRKSKVPERFKKL
ncbi:hypothetical protein M231_07923 [Tremella mesenterica]|uniref:Uncharacterized protein n=1 Tax=Tremella mesenterica TaxID=5217 RepID=A0A4Q1B879_TREME|nr:uncharacterized protein TREMEDRAFT_68824 [Tremella mesenterica DSM 1558]EIW69699.1 hypothetical protein TREMEDRAFT_68824 [Tremella mesenterica DSM 1558]RXK34822.1 hypothetical protein M231_07923 [Tremella mesenterica]